MENHAFQLKQAVHWFRTVRRWEAAKLAVIRAAWTLLAAVLVLLLADFLLALGDGVRLLLDVFLLALPVVVGVLTYRRLTRSTAPDRMVARMLEAGHPELGNDLINALDFGERLNAAPPEGLSEELMREEITRAAEEASRVKDFAPLRPPETRRERYVLLGAVAGALLLAGLFPRVAWTLLPRYLDPFGDHPPYCGTTFDVDPAGARVHYGENVKVTVRTSGKRPEQVTLVLADARGHEIGALPMLESTENEYFQNVENVTQDLLYFARVPRGRSTRHPLSVILTPRIDGASAAYRYPDYTGKEPETRDLSDPPALRGYRGTEVTLTLTSNRPLMGGKLTACGTAYPLEPAGEKAVAATFQLSAPGEFSATVTDTDGAESHASLAGKVEVVPDEVPTIQVTSPGMDSFATPDTQVPLTIEATDDLGIARITLIRSFNGSRDMPKRVFEAEAAEPAAAATETLDLADLGVRPGDLIDYYATATDTFPGEPHTAASPAFRLKIVSAEEYREFMQSQVTSKELTEKYEKLLDAIQSLADEQERLRKETADLQKKLDEGQTLSPEDLERLQAAEERQQALADQAKEAAEALRKEAAQPSVFDVEDALKQQLAEAADRIDESRKAMEQGRDALERAKTEGPNRQQAMAEAADAQTRAMEALGRGELAEAKAVEAARDIQDAADLMQNAENFKYLYTLQQGLERQARTYRDSAAPSLDDRVRLKELAEQQQTVREAMDQLKRDLREDGERLRNRFPKAAEDARRIADEIESRSIEPTMENATGNLSQGLGQPGHRDVERARSEMEAMIDFSESMGSGASQECELRLQIRMGASAGQTLGQMAKGMQSGLGGNQGFAGQGSGGMLGGMSPFGLFGNDTFSDKSNEPSGAKRHKAQSVAKPGTEAIQPGHVEQSAAPKADERQVEAVEGEQVMDEYRGLIDRYFQRLAEEGE